MHQILTGRLQVEKLTIAIPNLPEALQGTKVVQLSDFHYESWGLSEDLLQAAIAASNQASPDLVFLTGDYVTEDPSPIHRLANSLKSLRSRAGIYAILGNHDIKKPDSKTVITDTLTGIGVCVLWNEAVYPLGPGLALVGMAEWRSGQFNPKVLARVAPEIPRIVLSHNPDTAEFLRPWRVDLQLSGHTHGGQIIIPKLGPFPKLLVPIRRRIPKSLHPWVPYMAECYKVVDHWQWSQGFHRVGKNQLYVNRGLGTYLPGRLFCRPEVTVFTLDRE